MIRKQGIRLGLCQDVETTVEESELLIPLKDVHCYQMTIEPETYHTVRMVDDFSCYMR